MSTRQKKEMFLAMVMVCGALSLVFSGCTAGRVDLVKNGDLTLQEYSPGKVYIAGSDAYQEGEGFVVKGILRRSDTVGVPIKAHVDATVQAADGTIIDQQRSSDIYVSRRFPGRMYLSFERFKVPFSCIPPQGSTVCLVSHSGSHDDVAVRQ